MTSEPEKLLPEAREFFALECEKHGFDTQAAAIRAGNISYVDGGQVCIDAMIAFARHCGSRETGAPCEACGKPVEVGQVVLCYDDAGEMHADCEHPFALDYTRKEGEPEPVVLLGSPMRHVALSRLSSPVSGTDMVMVPVATLNKRSVATMDPPYSAAFNAALDMVARDAVPLPSTPCTMGVGCDEAGVCYAAANGAPEHCPASPSTPIPMIAEAGERETAQAHDHARSGDYRMAYLKMCKAYGRRTPATLDNTAVEGLRALSERATPGPWAWEQCGEKEDVPVVGIAFPGDDPDCKAPYEGEFRDSDASRMTIGYDWQSCDGHSPSANAAFAVAAVNFVRATLTAKTEKAE